MRKIFCVSALVWALCGSAFAGDIQNPPVALPQPQTNVVQEQGAGDIIRGDDADGMTQLALDLFAVMQSLF